MKGMVWPPGQGAGLSQRKHVGSGLALAVISVISETGSTTRYLHHRPDRPHRGPKQVMRLSVRCPKSHLWPQSLWDCREPVSLLAEPPPLPAPTLQGPGQGLSGAVDLPHLMQFFGSSSQSVLQRKRSQASQPMGGVRRSPFSSTSTWSTRASKSTVGSWGMTVSGSHSPGPHPPPPPHAVQLCTRCQPAH